MAASRLPINVRLPGAYFDVRSLPRPIGGIGSRGTVAIMADLPWGDTEGFFNLPGRVFLTNKSLPIVGMTAVDFEENKQLRLALAGCQNVLVLRANVGGDRACGSVGSVAFEAWHFGAAGNNIRPVITKNALDEFVVSIFWGNTLIDRQTVSEIAQLQDVEKVVKISYPVNAELTVGTTTLEGGTDGTVDFTAKLPDFFKQLEYHVWEWDVAAFAFAAGTPERALCSQFMSRLNEEYQLDQQCVVIGDGANNRSVIGVEDALEINNEVLSLDDMVFLTAGIQAGLELGESATNLSIDGAARLIPEHTRDELRDANERGVIVHTRRSDRSIAVLRDINSFVSLTPDFNYEWTKNMVVRTINNIKKDIHRIWETSFKGKVHNTIEGRATLFTEIHGLLLQYQAIPAIQNHTADRLTVELGERSDQVIIRISVIEVVDVMEELDVVARITGGRPTISMTMEGALTA